MSGAASTGPVMMVWPSVPAWRAGGRLWLDRKFVDGMRAYCARWAGPMRVLMHVEDVATLSPFGVVDWATADHPFELDLLEAGQTLTADRLRGVSLLLASADDFRQLDAADTCAALGVACVHVIEYTLRTRLDMARHSGVSTLRKLKTMLWHLRNERRIRRALGRGVGLQANGLPAFNAYGAQTKASLLYFDTRLARGHLISQPALDARLAALAQGGPLRLAFSGRLIEAKGADALIPLGQALRNRGVAFSMHVFGAGELLDGMRAQVAAQRLGDVVVLEGAVDFDGVLVPALKERFDLFICCHRQGDPSCTYAETFGCGVPMAGFANESLAALASGYDVGWTVPMNDHAGLAELVARLAADRQDIAAKSRNALRFALENNFEHEFQLRMDHCAALVPGAARAA